jgi:hypothetical protein
VIPKKRAKALAKKIAESTDTLNDRLTRMEDEIRSWELGVSASIELEGPLQLYWGRGQGKSWGLYIHGFADGHSPLASCARDYRIMAAEKMPQLVDKLLEEVHVVLARVQRAITQLDELLEALWAAADEVSNIPSEPAGSPNAP